MPSTTQQVTVISTHPYSSFVKLFPLIAEEDTEAQGIECFLQVTQLRLMVNAICLTSTATCLENQCSDTRVDLQL